MLIVRAILLCCALAVAASAALGQAASQPSGKQRAAGTPQGQAKQDQSAARLDTSSLEKTIREVVKEQGDKHDPHVDDHAKAEGKLVEYTRKLAFDTDRLAEFTFWLVAATGVMAAIVFGQLLMFRSQLKIMRDGVGDAKTVADAAKAGAELSRDEFFATHRPRMVIRRLSFEVSGGYPVELNYTVHNVGDAAGTIVARSGSLWLPNENESLATAPAEEAAIENIPVDSGDSQPVTHEIDDCQADLNFNYGLGPRPRILFVGYLKYTDRAGVVRETRFLREYSHDTKLFTAIDHPDYEYQD